MQLRFRAQPSRDPSSSPSFDAAELSARCTRALADVFHAHDVDGDGALADVDLARMQRRGFGVASPRRRRWSPSPLRAR